MKPNTKIVVGSRVRRKGFPGFWTVASIDGSWVSCTRKRGPQEELLRTDASELIPVGKQRTKGKRK